MTQRQEIIERLNGLELKGGSHKMLSAICKAVLPHGDAWTLRRCWDLRDRLVRLLGEVDTAPSGGRITDDLRHSIENAEQFYGREFPCLTAIADRIDSVYEQPIKLGDEVYQVKGGWVYTVKSITLYPDNTTVSFECKYSYGCDSAHNVRHYHAPAVEDVLREFADEVQRCCDTADTIAEYAAKLRLAGDAE